MKDYTVLYGQSLLDIALQECGTVEALIALCADNNLSITEDLSVGQILQIDGAKIVNKAVVQYYRDNNITLATDIPKPNYPQSIVFQALPAVLVLGQSYILTATATSGLPCSFSSSNTLVATIRNNIMTIVGYGAVQITASQVGNNTYFPAPAIVQAISILTPVLEGAFNESFSDSFN